MIGRICRQNAKAPARMLCLRISSLIPLTAALLISIFSSITLAEEIYPDRQHPAVQIGLFSGLTGLNPAKMLRDVHSGLNSEISPGSDFTLLPLASAAFDLLQYMQNNVEARTDEDLLAAIPKYNRVEMFGGWVNENAPEDCLNTRAEVLMRDATSVDAVKFSTQNPCQVIKGEWNDPYSGTTFKLAKAVQIDHVVPLKNAYKSGAYEWTKDRRCHYANYLREENHLMAVSGHENMSKGDAGPERYLPPNEEYMCEYLHNWLKIKATWTLGFSSKEATAVLEALETHQCGSSTTKIPLPKFQNSRLGTNRMNTKCIDEFDSEQVAASRSAAR
ncbi:MAG: HNH endonuclease [Deltaproteobacteria bacterium]|nr:HNH endonuclease [Deltaproteobacteria bacterium]